MFRNTLSLFWFGPILLSFACGDSGTSDESDDGEMENAEDEAFDSGTDALPDSEDDASPDVFSPDADVEEDSPAEDGLYPDEVADLADLLIETDSNEAEDEAEPTDEWEEAETTCECDPGTTLDCTTSCGTSGTQICNLSCLWNPCRAEEICNNCDDDADGHVDDGIARACDDAPACPPGLGRQACVAGDWTTCVCVD